LVLENVGANDVRIQQAAGNALLRNIDIARLDARNGDLSGIRFENCRISLLIGDNNTRFGIDPPQIDVVQLDTMSGSQTLREVNEKQTWLGTHSSQGSDWDSEENRRLPIVKLFDRICRRFISQVYIRDTDEDTGSLAMFHLTFPTTITRFSMVKEIGHAKPPFRRAFP
jgi:hypothetical protein